jgi:CRP-like cAMP-binding protein
METDELRNILVGLPFMLDLPESLKQRLCKVFVAISKFETVEQGRVLFREGESDTDDGYIVLSGSVRVTKSYSGASKAFAPVLLGEAKQFSPQSERTATVEANDDLETLHFEWGSFREKVESAFDRTDREVLRKALLGYAWLHLLN